MNLKDHGPVSRIAGRLFEAKRPVCHDLPFSIFSKGVSGEGILPVISLDNSKVQLGQIVDPGPKDKGTELVIEGKERHIHMASTVDLLRRSPLHWNFS